MPLTETLPASKLGRPPLFLTRSDFICGNPRARHCPPPSPQSPRRLTRKATQVSIDATYANTYHIALTGEQPRPGAYSRRISFQHRLVYEVFVEERVVRVLRMRSYYT